MAPRDRDKARQLVKTLFEEAAQPLTQDGRQSIVVFDVGGVRYGVPATEVEAVTSVGFVAPVPVGPEAVRGISSVRGRMRLVVDLSKGAPESGAYLVVLRGDGQLALLADRVSGVRRIGPDDPVELQLLDPEDLPIGLRE